jgi:hypothetical protein
LAQVQPGLSSCARKDYGPSPLQLQGISNPFRKLPRIVVLRKHGSGRPVENPVITGLATGGPWRPLGEAPGMSPIFHTKEVTMTQLTNHSACGQFGSLRGRPGSDRFSIVLLSPMHLTDSLESWRDDWATPGVRPIFSFIVVADAFDCLLQRRRLIAAMLYDRMKSYAAPHRSTPGRPSPMLTP